jgi:hypothetical protein
MDIGYELIDENNILKIKHYIKIYGPLTFKYKRTIGKKMANEMIKTVKNLIKMTEE